MSDKTISDLATEITIATIENCGFKHSILEERNVKAITDFISEVYKTAFKTLKETE